METQMKKTAGGQPRKVRKQPVGRKASIRKTDQKPSLGMAARSTRSVDGAQERAIARGLATIRTRFNLIAAAFSRMVQVPQPDLLIWEAGDDNLNKDALTR